MIQMDVFLDEASVMNYMTDLEASQIPWATAQALNHTMKQVQQSVRKDAYLNAFEQRNKTLAKALTTIPRGHWATKKRLKVSMMNVRDRKTGRMAGEGFIERQINNQSKSPRGSSNIAVPVLGKGMRRNKGGSLPKGKKPRNNKKLFRVGNRLVERQRGNKLVTRFALTKNARPNRKGKFDYYGVAQDTTKRVLQRNWNREMFIAVTKTARRYANRPAPTPRRTGMMQ